MVVNSVGMYIGADWSNELLTLFFFNDTAPPEIYTLSLHDALPISIILRESTVRQGVSIARGEYQAVYRSVRMYHQLFKDAGLFSVEVRRNYGYTSMVTAEELVDMRRKWLPFLPKDSPALGSLTWWALRGTTPISFWAIPRLFSLLDIPWPRLQNHFFRLCPVE